MRFTAFYNIENIKLLITMFSWKFRNVMAVNIILQKYKVGKKGILNVRIIRNQSRVLFGERKNEKKNRLDVIESDAK